jgi:ABC-type transporter Mla subunit MlaD
MRRALLILLLVAACGTLLVVGTGAGDSNTGNYKVRAVFDNAVSVIPGEDVKIAGVKVGSIDSLDVTKDKKAAVVLDITNNGFKDFRKDAHCTIRPQSLIGEKFVECTLTVPKAPGVPRTPKLEKIKSGHPGAGQYNLGDRTSTPVDVDLINDVLRLPQRQRLSLIINELGTGLAGNAQELRNVIKRANPALFELDKVLKILADENQVLADLQRDSDTNLAPLARDRAKIQRFIETAGEVGLATAERSNDLEGQFQRFPEFLRQLRPTAQRLSALSDQMVPVLNDLRPQAPAINRLVQQLGPFSQASIPAFQSLGKAAEIGGAALTKSQPVIRDLRTFASVTKPLAQNLKELTVSLRDTGGIERLMDYLYYQVAAINGFDSFAHYLRAGLIVNLCSTYSTTVTSGCEATFPHTASSRAARAGGGPTSDDPALQRMAKILKGAKVQDVLAADAAAKDKKAAGKAKLRRERRPVARGISFPHIALPGDPVTTETTGSTPKTGTTGTTGATGATGDIGQQPAAIGAPQGSTGATGSDASTALLDYLLGVGSTR